MTTPHTYTQLAHLLQEIGSHTDVAQFHGILSGALCRLPPNQIDVLGLLDEESEPVSASGRAPLQEICAETYRHLAAAEGDFVPVLPEDDCSLGLRATALGAWCEGFLFGLAGRQPLELDKCSEDVRELIKDLSQFTRAGMDEGDDLEVEEDAYIELVEYLRVGVQLIFLELHPRVAGEHTSRVVH